MLCHILNTHRAFLLCVFYCDLLSAPTGRKTYHKWNRKMAYLPCVSFCDSSGDQTQRKPCHTGDRNKVFLLCEFSCESLSFVTGRRTLHTWSRSTESPYCASFCDSSGDQTEKKPCHTGDRDKVSLRSGFLRESSSFLNWRRILYPFSRSKESHHYVSYCVSSGPQTGRKPGHTGGTDTVSLRCEFSCGSLSYLTGRKTLYI